MTAGVDGRLTATTQYYDPSTNQYVNSLTDAGYDAAFTNKLRTEFEFTKEWWDSFEREHNEWLQYTDNGQQKDAVISVSLSRRLKYSNTLSANTDATFILGTVDLVSNTDQTIPYTDNGDNLSVKVKAEPVTKTLTDGKTVTVYKFKFSGLQKKGKMTINEVEQIGEWVYYVSELSTTVGPGELYTATYINAGNRENHNGETDNGGTIKNTKQPTFELPSTGGPGTGIFYILGSVLTLLAAVLLITKRRIDTSE